MQPILKARYIASILLIVVLVGLGLYFSRQLPSVAQQLNADSSRLTVRITTPVNKSHWQVGMPIPITATAIGEQPIQSMELWVDGNLMQSESFSRTPTTLTWMIQSLGEHTLLIRVKDARGNIANSNAVRVIGTEQDLAGMYAIYKAKPGDTVTKLATMYGTTPQNILGMNPNLNSASPIPDGSNVKILAPAPSALAHQPSSGNGGGSPAPNTPTQKPTLTTPNPYLFWVSKFTQQNPPQAPDLALNVNQCSVNILITNNAHNTYGLYIYRLDPNSQTFHRIATLAPNSNAATPIEYTDPKLYGSFSYYVSAFNALGEIPSKISEAQVTDSTCQTPFWAGLNLQQDLGPLTMLKYDKAYFYLEVNNQSWGRMPQDPSAFLSLKNGVFNANDQINAYLKPPTQGQEMIEMDAWGWQGGSLVHIGNFTRILSSSSPNNSAQTLINQNADTLQLEVCNQPATNCSQYQTAPVNFGPYSKVSFQWSANPGTYGIYQVWSFPLAASQNCPVNDPGVIYSGLVGEQNGSNTFTIDFTQLHTTATEFSVRVLALDSNGQSICEPSNVVGVAFNPPSIGQMPDPYTIQIKSINPGQVPNTAKVDCVVLTKNDFYPAQPGQGSGYDDLTAEWIGWYAPWPVGTELCPPPYQPPGDPCADSFSTQCAGWTLQQEGKLVENGTDELSQDFATAKSWAIGEVESATGCTSDLCNQVITAGVDAGLAELGIPPSVPNSVELKQDGESYIADEILDQAGVSCTDPNDPCNQLVQMGHDQAKQKIVNALDQALQQNQQSQMDAINCQSTDEAHNLGIQYFMCVPPAITGKVQWIPAPDSTGTPTVVMLSIARDPNVPDSALPDSYSCSFKINSSAKNDSYIGKYVFLEGNLQLMWAGTELTDTDNFNLSGLFHTISESIPKSVSSAGIQAPVILTPRSDAYPQADGYWIVGSGHWEYDVSNDSNGNPDDWAYLYRGADATFTVTESCSSSAGSFTDTPKDQQTISINK